MADLSRNRWPVIFGTGGRNPSEQVAEFIGIGTFLGVMITNAVAEGLNRIIRIIKNESKLI